MNSNALYNAVVLGGMGIPALSSSVLFECGQFRFVDPCSRLVLFCISSYELLVSLQQSTLLHDISSECILPL